MYFKHLLACLALLASPISGVFVKVEDVFELTSRVFEFVEKSWVIADDVRERLENENTPPVWYTKKKERKLMTKFGQICQMVSNTQKDTDNVRTTMLSSLKKLQSLPDAMLNGIQINELLESVRSIENDYTTMEEYKIVDNETNEESSLYTSYTLEKFADAMLDYSVDAPHKQLSKIHYFIVPEWEGFKFHTHGSIFNILRHTMESSDMLCDKKQSLQQLIYNLYTTLHLTQLKGFAVMQFSWMLLQTYGKGNFTFEKTKQHELFEKKISEQLNTLKNAMYSTNNNYWRCDPEKHIKNETYLEITQLLQGYVENESDMNDKQSCRKNCGYYEVAEHKKCYPGQLCAKQTVCNGKILNCRYIDSDMTICLSVCYADTLRQGWPNDRSEMVKLGSSRRYDYISYKNGKVFGDSSRSCKGTTSKVDSWWYFFVLHCSYCFCICESADIFADRYFSLKISKSNINQNKVVTGLRFTKVKHMFHLQVQEGELGPRGVINESSRQWVEIPDEKFTFKNKTLKEGIDYHVLTFTARDFDLDNVIAPANTVITGVQLRLIGTHLNLQVFVTEFEFLSGKLNLEVESYPIGNENTEHSQPPRLEIDINNSDLPTKLTTATEPDMSSNKYIKFTHSSIDLDVAQTTLPFIDVQPVEPYPGVPLSGIGIYFKGIKDYGGFIGASVFTYNFSENLNSSLFSFKKA